MIFEVIKEVHKTIDAYDKIPTDFNFLTNKYAVEVKVAESINSNNYKTDITLQIRIVGLEINKETILKKAEETDTLFNKKRFLNCRVLRENAWYTSYRDEDKFNIVLQYMVRKI